MTYTSELGGDEQRAAMGRRLLPLIGMGAVAFLVSDPGPFISGQILRVDGGGQLWPA